MLSPYIVQQTESQFLADNGFWFAYERWLCKHNHDPMFCAVAAVAVRSSRLVRSRQLFPLVLLPTFSKPISWGSSRHG